MPKRVLIIHGLESNSKEHWFLEEKERLEKLGYEVTVPDMPNPFYPQKDEWVQVVKDFNPDENSIIVGHSLGGTTILRYLEEANNKAGKCIFIAAPIINLGEGYEKIENFLKGGFNWEKIKKASNGFVVLNQKDDPAVPFEQGRDLARYLGMEVIVAEGNDHFDKIDFTLLEKYI